MSQASNTLILAGIMIIFAFGFIYFVRKETKKMEDRKYKKFKGEKLLREQLR
jgi:preprotein translocase subunit YajC